ncbi:MAG: phosphoesterase [Mycobacterium sp.]|nr:phosphoesterase [Mycobacterium sp.]
MIAMSTNSRANRAVLLGLVGVLALTVCATRSSSAADPAMAGPRADGSALLPTGYVVTPGGEQTWLGDLPLGAAASPDGRWLAVSNDGQATQSLQVIDTATGKVTQTVSYRKPEALFAGLAFSGDGQRLYASGGGNNKIRTFDVANGVLTERAPLVLPTTTAGGGPLDPFPSGVAVTGDGRLLVADRLADAVTAIDPRNGASQTVATGHAPATVVVSRDGNRAWVGEQGAATVEVLDVSPGQLAAAGDITVGTHPAAMVLDKSGARLFAANADSDQISVIDTGASIVTQTIPLAPYQGAQVGANPIGLAISGDDQTLFVANSGDNDIAVIDIGRLQVRGLIPTGWYPSTVTAVGPKLFVTNAKGVGAGPNNGPGHPDPTRPDDPAAADQYAGSMIRGTLSVIDGFTQSQLDTWTRQVYDNDGFDAHGEVRGSGQSPVVPPHPGQPSPIKHIIYVVKENRTYDQEFGSLGKGNGDPSLNLFGDESVPNARELQRRYVTLDNFYADAEVSAQGWMWTVAANSNLYTESGWPANYSDRNHPYPAESGDSAIAPNTDPADSYIWDRLAKAGVSFRNYGFYVSLNSTGDAHAADPVLDGNTDHAYRGFNMQCPDSPNTFAPLDDQCGLPRITEWQREFADYVAADNLPTVEFVRLPNDHTVGTKPDYPTPQSYALDNDLALGALADTVSHSKYWPETAIFVTEDDAQDGPDHVDAHRTVSQVISPYTQTGGVDSTLYSTSSMLRTMELVVGLTPMTQFDASATPMVNAFSTQLNTAPYDLRHPTGSVATAINTANAPMATQSEGQNVAVEDAIDERTFNQAIWQSIRGAGSIMPEPRHTLAAGTSPTTDSDR